MELEGLISHGCEKAIRELMTVKNDWNAEKRNLMSSLIETGTYNMPDVKKEDSRTNLVVNSIIKFLKE